MGSKKVFIFSSKSTFIATLILLYSSLSIYSMEKEEELVNSLKSISITAPSQTPMHIVSPEAVEIQKKLAFVASLCPKIARPLPQIDSQENFDIAKIYFELSTRYDAIFRGAALASGGQAQLFLDTSQQILIGLQSYITTLRSDACTAFRTKEDEEILRDSFYNVIYNMGENHIMSLTQLMAINQALEPNLKAAQSHTKAIKIIKEQLSESPKYRKKLQASLQHVQDMVPAIQAIFHPEMKRPPNLPSRKFSRRIEERKKATYYQKQLKAADVVPLDSYKESFDLYFQLSLQKMLKDELLYSTKKVSCEEYVTHLQDLTKKYFSLESEGWKFGEHLGVLQGEYEANKLEPEKLVNLYRFFKQRFALFCPNKDSLHMLEHIIFMLLHANNLEDALIRTEVLTVLLNETGKPLPKRFIAFRASVLALNGNSDEWRKIKEEKIQAKKTEEIDTRQRQLGYIKEKLEHNKKKQQELAKGEIASCQAAPKAARKSVMPATSVYFEPYLSAESPQPEAVIPRREKIKTRKVSLTYQSRDKEEIKHEPAINESTPKLEPTLKKYKLSQNALKTYRKIRRGERNFSRQNLYNLFEKLECEPSIKQGKGDHGKIPAPLNMTVRNREGLVAVIPEFSSRSFTKTPFPLTVPNWDEKWDGKVPHYMMKSIIEALNFIGATDDTVY
ncbi:hypothetical protein [Candidatus Odyssella acanthamoebae]|uniref:Uncharacterized protein n=1 Tax=Candidatus Odyssella acanthamoebae TaxID=91604 RepID=A0A077AXZ0_9PROT|nr:hypothetical protein [Candidatus Paracaedibacter acanthamoebae]AIK95610.1 hypothetical protein ID47_00815 [Candidatus Paracaedibacter acanthamoebae]